MKLWQTDIQLFDRAFFESLLRIDFQKKPKKNHAVLLHMSSKQKEYRVGSINGSSTHNAKMQEKYLSIKFEIQCLMKEMETLS